MTEPLKLVGVPGSPYSRKLRAVLRYRRIPFQWIGQGSLASQDLPPAPLPLIPVLYFPGPDGYEATSDTTFQIRRLETEFKDRSLIPPDPAVAFLDTLIEDYADEWTTKMMFHYRWAISENVENANKILPRWMLAIPEPFAEAFPDRFGRRQIDRLRVVGSNATTGPVIEASYQRLLKILERHLREHPFLLGRRPGAGDFGLFGQLTQLVQVEPTSQALARRDAPRVIPWCDNIEDLSGWRVEDCDWVRLDGLPDTVRELFAEIGRTYAPFLIENARALNRGAEQVEATVDGARWTQVPFRYQGKCLAWLREAYQELAATDREAVNRVIHGTGCEALFA